MRKLMIVFIFLFNLSLIIGLVAPTDRCLAETKLEGREISLVRIGFKEEIFGSVDKKDAQAVIDLYIKQFAGSLNIETEAIIYADNESIVADLLANRLDMVCASSIDYYQISKVVRTELAYTNTNNGRKMRKSMLVVRNDIGIDGIEDLKGKKLSISEADRIGRMFINTVLLREQKQLVENYFANIILTPKPSKMVLDVFFKKSDACLIDDWIFSTMSELNPQIQKQLKIIVSSPYMTPSVTFFREKFGEKLKEGMKEIAVKTALSPYGQQLLILFRSDNIAQLQPSDLDSVRRLRDEHEQRMQNWKGQLNVQ